MRTNKVISALSHLLQQVKSVFYIQESRENQIYRTSNDYRINTEV